MSGAYRASWRYRIRVFVNTDMFEWYRCYNRVDHSEYGECWMFIGYILDGMFVETTVHSFFDDNFSVLSLEY